MKTLITVITLFLTCHCFGNDSMDAGKNLKCGQCYVDPVSLGDFKIQNIIYQHGVAFKNGKAIYIDAAKMKGADVFLSSEERKERNHGVLKNSILAFLDQNSLWVYDSTKKDPYFQIVESKREYCVKIEKYKMYLRSEKSNWEPVSLEYLGNLKKTDMRREEDELNSCMLLEIKTKWFSGVYEVWSDEDN